MVLFGGEVGVYVVGMGEIGVVLIFFIFGIVYFIVMMFVFF